MPLAPRICIVCGQHLGAAKGQWHALQPDADGAYRCRICKDVRAALTTVTTPTTSAGDGK